MIVPLVTVWASAQHDPAHVGVTGLGLAVVAWLLLEAGHALTDAHHTPPATSRAVISDSRNRRGHTRTLRWADLWRASNDAANANRDAA